MKTYICALILLFISTGVKKGATVPIIIGDAHGHVIPGTLQAIDYINPLPHVLMLTAIVVMVATFGVALALLIMIFKRYKTFEEDEILEIRSKEAAT